MLVFTAQLGQCVRSGIRAGTASMLLPDAYGTLREVGHISWLTRWPRGAQFKPQMLANLLWALATLAVAPPHLLSAVAAEVLRQLPGFKPQARARGCFKTSFDLCDTQHGHIRLGSPADDRQLSPFFCHALT